MYLVEIITDAGYWTSTAPFERLDSALAFARGLRTSLAGKDGYIGVRVINLAFATRQ
jgi:hypothetical protein